MTTTTTAPRAQRPRFDERYLRVQMLLRELDHLDPHATAILAEARRLIARAQSVTVDGRAVYAQAKSDVDAAVAALADGKIDVATAVSRVAVVAPWLSPRADLEGATVAGAFLDRTAKELSRRVFEAARDDGMKVHAKLAKLADVEVRRAVAAGAKLLDVEAVLAVLKPPQRPADLVQTSPQGTGWQPMMQHLSAPTIEDIQTDPTRMGFWAEATAATKQLQRLVDVAELLHSIMGGSSTAFGTTVDRDQLYLIGRDLPAQLHWAVYDALGWKPGLHLNLRPGERRPSVGSGDIVVGGIRYPAGYQPKPARIGPPVAA